VSRPEPVSSYPEQQVGRLGISIPSLREKREHISGRQSQWAVVVAVVTVWKVQVAVDQIIDMVAVRDHVVAAVGAVDVAGVVTCTAMLGSAGGRVGVGDGNDVFVNMVAVREVQVTIMQIINVIIVMDGSMAAVGTVLMGVCGMLGMDASGHKFFL